ncbi:hypothetical protein JTB14_011070 [Gonioctena quinquepunctata]|nr:hypothetical protein JTB14_011070 [Gonioctena quinquepunctata]
MELHLIQVIDIAQKLERSGFKLSEEKIGSFMLAGLTEKIESMVIAIEHAEIDVTADSIESKLLDMHLGGTESQSCGAFANEVHNKGGREGCT